MSWLFNLLGLYVPKIRVKITYGVGKTVGSLSQIDFSGFDMYLNYKST